MHFHPRPWLPPFLNGPIPQTPGTGSLATGSEAGTGGEAGAEADGVGVGSVEVPVEASADVVGHGSGHGEASVTITIGHGEAVPDGLTPVWMEFETSTPHAESAEWLTPPDTPPLPPARTPSPRLGQFVPQQWLTIGSPAEWAYEGLESTSVVGPDTPPLPSPDSDLLTPPVPPSPPSPTLASCCCSASHMLPLSAALEAGTLAASLLQAQAGTLAALEAGTLAVSDGEAGEAGALALAEHDAAAAEQNSLAEPTFSLSEDSEAAVAELFWSEPSEPSDPPPDDTPESDAQSAPM